MMKPLSKQLTTPTSAGVKGRIIIQPKGGWEEREYYLVDVAFNKHNVIHRTIFYAGFLNDGEPAGYNQFWFHEEVMDLSRAYFVKPIAKINMWPDEDDELQKLIANNDRLRTALNRRASVEEKLWMAYHGKIKFIKEEYKDMAVKLGVPEEYQSESNNS